MIIRQLSVFLENRPGRLCDATDVLAKNNIDISALSLADTDKFGILRLIVDNPALAKKVLAETGIVSSVTEVIAVAMNDVPGGAVGVMNTLSRAGINLEYMYAFIGRTTGKALMVIRADKNNKAEEILCNNGFCQVNPADVYRIG